MASLSGKKRSLFRSDCQTAKNTDVVGFLGTRCPVDWQNVFVREGATAGTARWLDLFDSGPDTKCLLVWYFLNWFLSQRNNAYVIALVRRPVKGCRILKCFVNQQSNLSASKISAHLYWILSPNWQSRKLFKAFVGSSCPTVITFLALNN